LRYGTYVKRLSRKSLFCVETPQNRELNRQTL
jgi:hypothetical protein